MPSADEKYQLLKAIIDKELGEIAEEMSTLDNSDINSVIKFHIKHGIRDAEERQADNEPSELEVPYGTSAQLTQSMNTVLLELEVLLQYFYQACYFGTTEEQSKYKKSILALLDA